MWFGSPESILLISCENIYGTYQVRFTFNLNWKTLQAHVNTKRTPAETYWSHLWGLDPTSIGVGPHTYGGCIPTPIGVGPHTYGSWTPNLLGLYPHTYGGLTPHLLGLNPHTYCGCIPTPITSMYCYILNPCIFLLKWSNIGKKMGVILPLLQLK